MLVVQHTGGASLVAALTTSLAFFALMLTEFRAFTEFGFIAGTGVLLAYVAMYTVLPALIVILEQLGWRGDKPGKVHGIKINASDMLNPLKHQSAVLWVMLGLMIFALDFAPQLSFEKNFQNLEAKQPEELIRATNYVGEVFQDSHDRAIVVIDGLDELIAVDAYFKSLIASDTETPTIEKVSSLLDYIPDQHSQGQRLEIIHRLAEKAQELKNFDPSKYTAVERYLTIEDLNIADLPQAMRRTFLGTGSDPGYLFYIYNSVSMDDSDLARQFYDDAASFTVNGKTYYSAAEGFIFVEMMALLKAEAVKAIVLVVLTTSILVLVFVRSIIGTIIILLPPLLGVLVTIGIMGAFGPVLSIMNMVILPSLIGISVDNCIHIFHRFRSEGDHARITRIMNTTGRAAVLTTLTTLIGFGGMVTASMGGLRSMGMLAIIGFISCLLMTWMLLPVLLEYYSRIRWKGDMHA